MMKILIYGAGPLGSVFAAKLHQGGHEVSILARGQRLADLREHGVVLHDTTTGTWVTARVNVVETLAPDDVYDLILVIMRKNNALDILPILAANTKTPNVAFFMNNAAGPGAWVEALGKERVLIGFPSSAGYRDGHVVHCLTGNEQLPMSVPFGEVDGSIKERTLVIAQAIDAAPGLTAEIRTDMDTWHKYHVALLMPSLAPALYACGTDRFRLIRTRDAIVLAIRAVHEGFRVLRAKGLPVTPRNLRIFAWLPEPLMVYIFRKRFTDARMDIAMVGHANAARDEMQHLAGEFMEIARSTDIPTPNIDKLYPYFDPETPLLPDGSQDISLDWRGVWAGVGICAALFILLGYILKYMRKS
ncbi:MAG: ketopantoate reductase family protein [Anaerolineae bacterium]|nr:ketopantoate reductase family protein [Anaerolineae bacterium]